MSSDLTSVKPTACKHSLMWSCEYWRPGAYPCILHNKITDYVLLRIRFRQKYSDMWNYKKIFFTRHKCEGTIIITMASFGDINCL